MQKRIHLDQINGVPLLPEVRTALSDCLEQVGNPSSLHAQGREAARLRDAGRSAVAALVGARPEEVIFTSSGTEANHWALTGLAQAHAQKGRHLIVSAVEHASVLQTARRMEKNGWKVTQIPVDRQGRVDLEALERALAEPTALVSIQWANGEVGTLQPIAEIVRCAKAQGAVLHTDAVAAAGRVPIDLRQIPADALSLAGNTLGGPPGVGALVVRKGVRIPPVFVGGTQEEGRRAGTENLLGIVGFGRASAAAAKELPEFAARSTPLRDHVIRGILISYHDAVFHGHPAERLPGHVSVSLPGIEAERLVLELDLKGIAVGVGSACTALVMKASHVLKAMGVPEKQARGAVTCTWGARTAESEIDRFLEALKEMGALRALRLTGR